MPLPAGTRLGAYEIFALLGVGGMGEVYRARDTSLGRDVALKLLPDTVAADPDRLARFEREARALAALNHPNIGQIYGVEVAGGTRALVMELVDGATLEAVLLAVAQAPSTGLPVADAIAIARQIAAALEAAHDVGIVHRDLKPANVLLKGATLPASRFTDGRLPSGAQSTPDVSGAVVKVLDFGLAKAQDDDGSAGPESESGLAATRTSPALTGMGIVLGTAAYMAPEQAKGRSVDKRADIWAFGVVCWEMLTGRRAYDGDTVAETIAHVLTRDVDLDALPPETPLRVRELIARCLVRDPRQRLRDIGEARIVLDAPDTAGIPAATRVGPPPAPVRSFVWAAAGLVAGMLAAWGTVALLRPARPDAPPLVRSQVAVLHDGSRVGAPAISPDGRAVAYTAANQLWVQWLDQWEPRSLAGTRGASRPAWSPDSAWVAFVSGGRLHKVPALGGTVVSLGGFSFGLAGEVGGAAWRDDGSLVLGTAEGGAPVSLFEVPSAGGPPAPIRTPAGLSDFHEAAPLPGRSEVLVVVHGLDRTSSGIALVRGGDVTMLVPGDGLARPAYSPTGHVVYESRGENRGIWAVPVSLDRLATTGDPFFVAQGSMPSVSATGTLAYRTSSVAGSRQLVWIDGKGGVGGVLAPPQAWEEGLALSPDGKQLAASDDAGLWVYDVTTKARRLVARGRTAMAAWVGSDRVAFTRLDGGGGTVVLVRADGAGAEQTIANGARYPKPFAGGRRLTFNLRGAGGWEPAWVDLGAPDVVHTVGPAHVGSRFPEVSPDGGYLLYIDTDTGDDEVWVTRFPSGEGKWQVSTEGGGYAQWSPAGDAIVYRAGERGGLRTRLMSVPFTSGPEPAFGAPRTLFDWDASWAPYFAIAPDVSRFVAAAPVQQVTIVSSVRIVQHWFVEFAAPRQGR
jgi:serine/threonine-protein kinase